MNKELSKYFFKKRREKREKKKSEGEQSYHSKIFNGFMQEGYSEKFARKQADTLNELRNHILNTDEK
jgi:Tfp pilus assembly ATPase PilU